MIICNMGIKYGKQLRYTEMVFVFLATQGKERQSLLIIL